MPKNRALTLILIVTLALASSAGTSTYTLRWGDTLSRVARSLGVSVQDLAAVNGIENPHQVRAGRRLTVPGAGGGAAAPAATSTTTHHVRLGETLIGIARRHGTSVSALKQANGIDDADRIREGQVLTITITAGAGAGGGGEGATTAPVLISNSIPAEGLCPVRGAGRWDISNSFSAPRPGYRRHQGNDIFARRGTPVVANVGGTLRHASGARAGLAYYLAGDDGATYYGAHLDTIVGAGRVEAGQVIGTVGTTGNAMGTPAHLHFEVKPDGSTSVDPHAALRRWCR